MSESNRVSARNKSTQSEKILNRNRSVILSKKSIANRLIQTKSIYKIDLRLDRVFSKNSNSENSDSKNSNSKDSDSKNSYISRKTCSIQRKSLLLQSIYIAKNAVLLYQSERNSRYFFCKFANSYSNFVKSVQYKIWNSQSQLSELTEVKSDLNLSTWKTILYYNSYSNLFVSI